MRERFAAAQERVERRVDSNDYVHAAGATPAEERQTSDDLYGAIFNRGEYFAPCRVPNDVAISICAAVREGRALGVSVRTNPASATLQAPLACTVLRCRPARASTW